VLALFGIAATGAAATVATLMMAGVVFASVVAMLALGAFLIRRRQGIKAASAASISEWE
jgi:hypothetical protein